MAKKKFAPSADRPTPQSNDQTIDQSEQLVQLEQRLARVTADYENFRRRTEEERRNLIAMAQAHTLLELTPIIDNFRRATTHLPAELQNNNWVTGVLYVEKQLEQICAEIGLEKIKTVGLPFDPALHEAIETEPSDSQPANHITVELEGGYVFKGKVLKPAKVKVSSGSTS